MSETGIDYAPVTLRGALSRLVEYQMMPRASFDHVQVISIEAPDGFSVDCLMEKTTLPFKFKVGYKPIVGQPERGGEYRVKVTVKATGPEKEQDVDLVARFILEESEKKLIEYPKRTIINGLKKTLSYTVTVPEFTHVQIRIITASSENGMLDELRPECKMEISRLPFQFKIHYEPKHLRKAQQYYIIIEAGLIGGERKQRNLTLICPVQVIEQEPMHLNYEPTTAINGVWNRWTNTLNLEQSPRDYSHDEMLKVNAPDGFIVDCKMGEKIRLPTIFPFAYSPRKPHDSGRYWIKIDAVLTGLTDQKAIIGIPVDVEDAPEAKYDSLTCAVCILPFSDTAEFHKPKIFAACGHTICAGCLTKLKIESTGTGEDKVDYVRCYKCRERTLLVGLPLDYSMLEAISAENRGDTFPVQAEIVANPIVECYENKFHESSIFCEECEQPYCRSCFDQVHSVRKNREHRGIPLTDRPAIIPMCDKHQDVKAKHVCQEEHCSDNNLLCGPCKNNLHKRHKVKNIEAVIEENEETLDQLLENIYNLESVLTALIEIAEKCTRTFKLADDQILLHTEQIKATGVEIEKKLEAYKRSRERLQEEMLVKEQPMSSHRRALQTIQWEITVEQKRKNNLHDLWRLVERIKKAVQLELPDGEVFFELKDCIFDPCTENIIYKPNTNTDEAVLATSGS